MIIPIIVLVIISYGLYKKQDIYNLFIEGSIDGIKTIVNITGAVLAIVVSVNIFLGSGFLEFVLGKYNIDIFPMAILRPISGNASLAIMKDIFIKHGADSFLGRLASTIQGSTDTTIYVLALYFSSIKISKTRYALFAGLCADIIGIISSIFIVKVFFGY